MNGMKKVWPLVLIPIVTLLAILVAIRIVGSVDYHHNNSDFFTFWLAGRLVAQGGNPYDLGQWLAGYHQFDIGYIPSHPIFLYPLPLALILVPIGILPFQSAYVTWVTLTELMIIVSLWILLSLAASPRTKFLFFPLLAGIVLFRPTLLTLIQGQVGGWVLFDLVCIMLLWSRKRWFWGGLLLGLLVLKPNLGVIIIGLLAIWLLSQKRWTALIGILACGVLLLIAGLAYAPAWISQYWLVGSNKFGQTVGSYPTLWQLGAWISPNNATAGLLLGGSGSLIVLIGYFRAILRKRAAVGALLVFALTIPVTLLITPYIWTYDHLLLVLPITAVILALDQSGAKLLLTAGSFLLLDALVVVLLVIDTLQQVELWNVILPLVVFGMCIAWLPGYQPSKSLAGTQ